MTKQIDTWIPEDTIKTQHNLETKKIKTWEAHTMKTKIETITLIGVYHWKGQERKIWWIYTAYT